jgi:hypothetical protein
VGEGSGTSEESGELARAPSLHGRIFGVNSTGIDGTDISYVSPVAQVGFLEWTGNDHLKHSKFAGLARTNTP